MSSLRILALSSAALIASCGGGAPSAGGLHSGLLRAARVHLELRGVAGEVVPELLAAEVRWNAARAGHGPAARVVAGRAGDPEVDRLVGLLGATVEGTRVVLEARAVETTNDALLAVLPDPDRSALPLTLAVGEPLVLRALASELAPGWRPEVCVWRRGRRAFEVRLTTRGTPRWGSATEHTPRWARAPDAYRRQTEEGAVAFVDLDVPEEEARAYFGEVARVRATLEGWFGLEPSTRPIQVVVERAFDPTGAATPPDALARVEPGSGVLVAHLPRAAPHDHGLALGAARLRDALFGGALSGSAGGWWIEAAALDAAGHWFGRELDAWCARVAPLVAGWTWDELVDPAALLRASPHVVLPLRARVFRALRGERTLPELVAALAPGAEAGAGAAALARLRAGWPAPADHEPRVLLEPGVQRRGLRLLAPLGFDAAGALGTEAFDAALAELHAVRGNGSGAPAGPAADFAVLDVAAAQQPGMGSGRCLSPDARLRLACGDAAFVLAVAAARARGLAVLVVPHLLSSPEGTFHGDLKRTRAEEWERFFQEYARFLTHVALSAELAGAEALALGAGLEEATRCAPAPGEVPPDDPALERVRALKAQAWAGACRRVRGLFAGSLTYVTRDARTLARLSFASELDFVASRLHPRLGGRPGAGEGDDGADGPTELRARAVPSRLFGMLSALGEAARAHGKPLVVAGAGLPATEDGWRGLHGGSGPVDPERSAAFLRALDASLERLAREGEPPRGLALDGWGTRPGGGAARVGPLDLRGLGVEALVGEILR